MERASRPRRENSSADVGTALGRSVSVGRWPARRSLRVVVGEDQPLVRAGVVRVLEEDGFEVVAVAGDAPDLLRKARAHKPDVVVTDIQMPPDSTDDGLRAAIEIRATQPEIGVVVLSQFLEDRYALDLVGDRAERRRLPAQGPRRRPGAVHRRGPARRARRLGARSRGRAAHGRPATRERARSTTSPRASSRSSG